MASDGADRILRPWGYPLLDEGYDGAMDALDDADNERGEAAIALDRELHPTATAGPSGAGGFSPGRRARRQPVGRDPPGRSVDRSVLSARGRIPRSIQDAFAAAH